MADLERQKEFLGNDNYARLLEVLQQMDEKLRKTSQSAVADLRQELIALIDQREQARDARWGEVNEQMSGRISGLEGSKTNQGELMALKKELEQLIRERDVFTDNRYQRLVDLLSEQERRGDTKFTGLYTELRETLQGRINLLEERGSQNHQKALDQLAVLGGRIDTGSEQILSDMAAEIKKIQNTSAQGLVNTSETLGSQIQQLSDRVSTDNNELNEKIIGVQREIQRLLNDRSYELERNTQTNNQKAIDLIVQLERKLEKEIND